MGYGNTFNPVLPTNKPFNPNNIGNPLVSPTISLIPDCNVLSLAKNRLVAEWQSFLNNFGFVIYYKKTGYSYDSHDFLFGEDPTSPFPDTKIFKGFLEVIDNTHFFSPLGFENKKTIVLTVSINDYQNAWGEGTYPTTGDIFYVKNMACGDLEKESEEVYKVTDKNLNEKDIDVLFGGYCWKINAIRLDYSYEPNSFVEKGNTQPNDDSFMGILSGGRSPETVDEKDYTETASAAAEEDFPGRVTNSIYGNDL